jgi:transposase
MTPDNRITELEAENAALRARVGEIALLQAQIQELVAQVQDLQARLANATKDSHTSHKPPSSDPLGRKRPRSQRRKSGKKPGGQLGHRGETLHLVATPDEVVEHRPVVCVGCQAPLDETASVVLFERRQVRDVPPVRLLVREHRALHVRCPVCDQLSVGQFPPEAPSRAQYGPRLRALAVYLLEQQLIPYARVREVVAELLGAPLSLGTLTRWVRQGAETLRPVEAQIKAALQRAPVVHNDETGIRRAGKLAWAHVASTARLTHYGIHAKRGREATDAIGILPGYQGVSVHDGWKPYRVYTQCRHALCNLHHLRELTFLEEEFEQTWAKELKGLLLAMKEAVEQARTQGESALPAADRHAFLARYDQVLAAGLAANPPPERRPGQRGRLKQSRARNLLERLLIGKAEVLAFLDDFAIPFDNNQAEQDLRMLKVQQKIAGSFRADSGSEAFARIRGYLSSMRKQGVALLAALQTVFTGQPLYPAFD